SIVPNPFYAKTGFNLSQIKNGLEYTGIFMTDYAFYGAAFLIPLLVYRRLSNAAKILWWLSILFAVYITFIGGDVLKVHRFFLPIFGTTAILTILSLQYIVDRFFARNLRAIIVVFVTSGLIALTVYLPYDFVMRYNTFEKGFTQKMQIKARHMLEADSTDFSVALPTIGIFGYELIGHRIVDMVGLTDSTIARHAEEPVPGMQSTWKEVKHNSEYLLSSNLDYIIFSTDLKPSAPAERALLLYPQFLQGYRTVGWFYKRFATDTEGTLIVAYKRIKPMEGPFIPTYPVQWVEFYKQGLDAYGRGEMQECINLLEKAIQASPRPYYPYAIYQMAYCNMRLNNHDKAVKLNELVLSQDSL
ncbi:MAG: tetratricopeptide repeat protein, partial [Candidatus Zixiibacteriota bacterium]